MSDLKDAVIRAGFDFARQLANADFRRWLKRNGWQNGEHIVMTVDDEPVVDVLAKITLHTGNRAFVALAGDGPAHFRLIIVEPAPPRRRDVLLGREPIELAPTTNMGMLYAALKPVKTYFPSAWSQAIRFEKVAVAA